MKCTNGQSSRIRCQKWGHLSGYHVYTWSYGHENVKNGSFFVFSAVDCQTLITVWAKYLGALKRCYLVL